MKVDQFTRRVWNRLKDCRCRGPMLGWWQQTCACMRVHRLACRIGQVERGIGAASVEPMAVVPVALADVNRHALCQWSMGCRLSETPPVCRGEQVA